MLAFHNAVARYSAIAADRAGNLAAHLARAATRGRHGPGARALLRGVPRRGLGGSAYRLPRASPRRSPNSLPYGVVGDQVADGLALPARRRRWSWKSFVDIRP